MLIRAGMLRAGGSKSGVLDLITGAGAAFAVQRLARGYYGPCCNIRRSSDNSTKDIYFAGWDFDATDFSGFIGGGSGFVTKWYDQSGNGRDASQSTAASQPQIVLNQIGGRPALKFSGSHTLSTASFASQTTTESINAVMERTGSFTTQQNVLLAVNLVLGFGAAANEALLAFTGSITATAADSAAHSMTGVMNGSSSLVNIDGTQTTGAETGGNASGAFVIGTSFTGNLAEAILWPSTILSTAQQSSLHSNQSAYYGTP